MKRLALILVLCLTGLSFEARAEEWLGSYVGSEVPGYEILKSSIVFLVRGGHVGVLNEDELRMALAAECLSKFYGKALVNVRFVVSLGEVSFPKKGGGVTVISSGVYQLMYGDCVTSVKPKAKK